MFAISAHRGGVPSAHCRHYPHTISLRHDVVAATQEHESGSGVPFFVKPLGQWEAIRPEITDPLVAAVSALLIAGTALLALLLDRLFGLDRLLAGHR